MRALPLTSQAVRDLAHNWVQALAVIALLVAAGAAGWIAGHSSESPAVASTTAAPLVTPARAAELVAQTSAAAQVRAVGDQAKIINASLPFSRDPVEAAAGFAISVDGLDHRRALLCLTQAVYYEAGFEPVAGRRAVAQVVLNRMRHPAFPKSVCGVVYQGSSSPVCQFSFVCDGSLYRAPAAAAWRQARDIAQAALGGYVESSVGAATHYHADYVAPYWAPRLSKIEKIGAHIFYRWPGTWGRRSSFNGRYVGEPRDPLALRPPPPAAGADPDSPEVAAAIAIVEAGPPIARAPNDVGGLLDTSKGWTLNIPTPDEINRKSSGAVAAQEGKPAPARAVAAAVAAPVAAAQ